MDTTELTQRLRGKAIEPHHAEYEAARAVWNGMIDRRPALVVRCAGTADVISALQFARDGDLRITVRAGGHGVAGKAVCDGGVVIDLGEMNDVHVDRRAKTARVGAGASWGQFDREAQAFGLAVTGGVDSRTGVSGLTLGGGVGYLSRAHGLSIDNLLSVEVVLADGRVVTASEDEHSDLFWALRGGGGNFGIVTSFEFRLHDVGPEVMTAQVFLPMSGAADALRAYRDFMAAAPDEALCYALFVNVPRVEPFPEAEHGRTALALVACHTGPIEHGEIALAPLAEIGDPMLSVFAPLPYVTLQSSFDAGAPDGGRYYWKATYLDELSNDLIDTLVERVDPLPGPFSNVFLEPLGGKISSVAPEATAFPHRRARFGLGISSGWQDPADDDSAIAWTRGLFDAVIGHGSGGVYSNYVDRDDSGRAAEAWGSNRVRLGEVKAAYDPENLFSGNMGIGG